MKKLLFILCAVLMLVIGIFLPTPDGISPVQQRSIALLLASVFLWTSEALPLAVSSMLVVGLLPAMGIVDSFSAATKGFLNTAIYFVLVVSMVNHAMIKSGVDQFVVRTVVKLSGGSHKQVALFLVILVMFLPIFMASAMARLRMFIPLIEKMNESYGFEKRSGFFKFGIWAFGGINQVTTMIVLTGGAFTILASQLISGYTTPISWLKWYFYVAPPVYLSVIISCFIMWKYFGIGKLQAPVLQTSDFLPAAGDFKDTVRFRATVVIVLAMLASWVFGDSLGIPDILPPIFALFFLCLPGVALISDKDFRDYDWENFIMIGSALSLTSAIEGNGTADWLSQHVFASFAVTSHFWVNLAFFIIAVLGIRLIFVSPSSALPIILPLSVSYGQTIGLATIDSILLTTMLVGCVVFPPSQSPTMLLAHHAAHFKVKDNFVLSITVTCSVIFSSILAIIFWW